MTDARLTDDALARIAAAVEPYNGYDGRVTVRVSDVAALVAEVQRLRAERDELRRRLGWGFLPPDWEWLEG